MVRRVVEQGWSLTAAAAAAEVSERPCSKWVARYRAEGESGLLDRSSAPQRRSPTAPTSGGSRRSPRCAGCGSPARRSPSCSGWPLSTVSGILTRIGMGRLGRLGLEPAAALRARAARRADPHRRQEARADPAAAPGKRITGGRAHYTGRAPTDRRRRVGAAPAGSSSTSRSTTPPAWPTPRSWPTRRPSPRSAFLRRARRVLRAPRHHRRARADRQRLAPTARPSTPSPAARSASATSAPGPYRPQTNGKAERFIRTMLGGWAYGAIYRSSQERTAALDGWLWHYNHRRRHAAIGRQPPSPG